MQCSGFWVSCGRLVQAGRECSEESSARHHVPPLSPLHTCLLVTPELFFILLFLLTERIMGGQDSGHMLTTASSCEWQSVPELLQHHCVYTLLQQAATPLSFSWLQFQYRAFTFTLTFLLYTSFHLSRKPISIVKGELHKNCSQVSELSVPSSSSQIPSSLHSDGDCSWKPFDKSNYKQLLGAMDYSFLCAYAVGMYLSGIIGERLPIRLYLTVGMVTSGLFTCLFGLGYVYNIHSLGFYIFVQVANGLVQTTGWPSVVTCIGNWFGKGRRGLIMGLWNSHTSVGNILGSLIAGYWVSSNWGLSFIVPGLIIAAMGVVCFLFLIEHPNDLKSISSQSAVNGNTKLGKSLNGLNGHTETYLQYKKGTTQNWDTELLLPESVGVCVPVQQVVVVKNDGEPSAISFLGALQIPVCLTVTVNFNMISQLLHHNYLHCHTVMTSYVSNRM
ncbi:hypothetical protein JZ751_020287 [Albula glossodonta]|uniref:Major facilitator superfamily (MFS) profile domain-containing protein n=1 Tax=Albula glossodonta TaxID=121402 RepID=A0A8T2MRS9_9TELE|nr:hypothetical protein JZ751_020287 [Albula glossodonta]